MPLRDHFRPPVDDTHSWDELHGGWPMKMCDDLIQHLPVPYYAAPTVHLGTIFEIDLATFHKSVYESAPDSEGGLAVAMAPPKATCSFETKLPEQDVYEVRVYDSRRNRRLVAAIEIISPSNKKSEEERAAFMAKVVHLLKNDICVSIVDVVSTINHNLCAEVFDYIQGPEGTIGDEIIYATTLRMRWEDGRKMLDVWYYPLVIGQPLPTLPIWLNAKMSVNLDLEATYEACCRTLRIQ